MLKTLSSHKTRLEKEYKKNKKIKSKLFIVLWQFFLIKYKLINHNWRIGSHSGGEVESARGDMQIWWNNTTLQTIELLIIRKFKLLNKF